MCDKNVTTRRERDGVRHTFYINQCMFSSSSINVLTVLATCADMTTKEAQLCIYWPSLLHRFFLGTGKSEVTGSVAFSLQIEKHNNQHGPAALMQH